MLKEYDNGLQTAAGFYYNLHPLKDIVNLPEMYCKQDFGWYGINGQNVKYAIVTYKKEFFELAKKTLANKECVWIKSPEDAVANGNCVAIVYDTACENETLLGREIERVNSRTEGRQGNTFYPSWVARVKVCKDELVDDLKVSNI